MAPDHAAQVNIIVIAAVERTVNVGAVVRLTIAEPVRGHLVVDVCFHLDPVVDAIVVRVVSHDVEAVLFASLQLQPLAARGIAAVLAREIAVALVGDEVQPGSLHDVVGHLLLDVVADGRDCNADGLFVIVDEEPATVEELGNLGLIRVPLGGGQRIVLILAGAAACGDPEGILQGSGSLVEGVGEGA